MKKFLMILSCFLFFMFAYEVQSATVSNTTSEQFNINKVAYVDMQEVLKNSKQYESITKERKAAIDGLAKFVDAAKKEIIKQSTEEQQIELEKKYNKELQNRKEKIEKEFSTKIAALEKNINDAISSTAKAQGYSIVLSKNVVFFGGKDITDAVKKAVK